MAFASTIRPLEEGDHTALFAYLDEQIRENGQGGMPLFQPISRAASQLTVEHEARFRLGLSAVVGAPSWRRMWLAFDAQGAIAGHIDLRARADEEAAHRVMLGIGVHRNARRQGLGLRLIGAAEAWARARGFAWIDLEVLSVNQAAIALYRQAGFEQTGEVQDMFRIDGEQHAYTAMSKRLA